MKHLEMQKDNHSGSRRTGGSLFIYSGMTSQTVSLSSSTVKRVSKPAKGRP